MENRKLRGQRSENRGQRSELISVICHLSSVLCLLSSVLCLLSSVLCLLTSVLCPLSSAVYAAEIEQSPIECNGDQVEYFEKEKKVIGTGNVVITHKDAVLTADKVTVWTGTGDTKAEGSTKLVQGEDILEGDKMTYNFNTKRGTITRFKGEALPWYVVGKEAERVNEKQIVAKKGYLTSCDHKGRPHWKLSAPRIEVYPGNMVNTYNAIFWLNPFSMPFDIPIMWVPFYCHPIEDDKPHVTVIPGKNKEWGYYVLTAWRYNLLPSTKGHFLLDYREKKDTAVGATCLYESETFGKANVKGYYMHERNLKMEHFYNRWTEEEPNLRTTEKEKGFLRVRQQWQMLPSTLMTSELYKYKNENFLKDYFFNEYEKDIRPGTYTLLTNYTGPAAASLLAVKRMNRFEGVTEKLPEGKIDINNIRISNSDFYYSSNLSAVNFHRVSPRYTDDSPGTIPNPTHQSRYDTYNQFSYLTKLSFLSVSPYAGTRQTYFRRGTTNDTPHIRGVFYTGTDISTKFFKVFYTNCSPLGMEINNLRHVITPTISYDYTPPPTMLSSKVEQFDGIDSIGRGNSMSFGLENRLQTKRGKDLENVDLATLLVNTNYNFNHTPGGQLGNYTSTFELKPYNWLTATSYTIVDPHTMYHRYWLKQANNDICFGNSEKWSFGLGQSYSKGSNSITMQLIANFIPGWKIKIYEDMDIRATRNYAVKQWDIKRQEYVITKDLHCWELNVRYNVDRDKGEEILFVFRLKAFPDIPFELGRGYHNPKFGSQAYAPKQD